MLMFVALMGRESEVTLLLFLDGDYDIGWSLKSDGSYDLIADLWGVAKKHNQTELIRGII